MTAPASASAAGPTLPPLPQPTAKTVTPSGTVGVAAATYKAASLSAGYAHTCVVTTKSAALCWGFNNFGQLGDNTATNRDTPVGVSGLGSKVASVSAGYYHSCAVTTKGKALCWGNNSLGQLGDNSATSAATPVGVYGLTKDVKAISAGYLNTCALTTKGKVWCWGENSNGQLGDGTTTTSYKPVAVKGLGSGVRTVSVGYRYACAITKSKAVKCWGTNGFGQLGDNTTTDRPAPVTVYGMGSKVASLSVGYVHTCATRTSGKGLCWGYNASGNLGDGTTTNSSKPRGVTGFSSKTKVVKAGLVNTCALKTSGALSCWGENSAGQVGDNTTVTRLTPVPVYNLGKTTRVSVGYLQVCAITSSKAVWCWGDNAVGQLGNGASPTDSPAPVKVSGF
ncbi:MAG: chromosome condensation regulator RCC1 [Actinobacteria bacterium]|nr:chromosome condensation regulator RCC1 [Actinomycetota bacterium]